VREREVGREGGREEEVEEIDGKKLVLFWRALR